jgi:hypothetical protein
MAVPFPTGLYNSRTAFLFAAGSFDQADGAGELNGTSHTHAGMSFPNPDATRICGVILVPQGNEITGCTIGGQNCTKVIGNNVATGQRVEIWVTAKGAVPSGTTADVVPSYASAALSFIGALSFSIKGAASATPSSTDAVSYLGSGSTTITIPVGGVGIWGCYSNGSIEWSFGTEVPESLVTGSHNAGMAYSTTAGSVAAVAAAFGP